MTIDKHELDERFIKKYLKNQSVSTMALGLQDGFTQSMARDYVQNLITFHKLEDSNNLVRRMISILRSPLRETMNSMADMSELNAHESRMLVTKYLTNLHGTLHPLRHSSKYSRKCELCGDVDLSRLAPYHQLHHIVPTEYGGIDVEENIAVVCSNCHRKIHGVIKMIYNISGSNTMMFVEYLCQFTVNVKQMKNMVSEYDRKENQHLKKRSMLTTNTTCRSKSKKMIVVYD